MVTADGSPCLPCSSLFDLRVYRARRYHAAGLGAEFPRKPECVPDHTVENPMAKGVIYCNEDDGGAVIGIKFHDADVRLAVLPPDEAENVARVKSFIAYHDKMEEARKAAKRIKTKYPYWMNVPEVADLYDLLDELSELI